MNHHHDSSADPPIMATLAAVPGDWDAVARTLYAEFQAGQVSRTDMAAVLPMVWRSRPDEDPLASTTAWQSMVEYAGYFVWYCRPGGATPARRPRLPRRLFRGAHSSRRFGMSWTANPAVAEHFAQCRQPPGEVGQVWCATFQSSRLLGYLHDEQEYLVNAAGAEVQPWTGTTPWCPRKTGTRVFGGT